MQTIRPKNFGVIVRTVAENKSVTDIENDLNDLVAKWDECFKALQSAEPPMRVLGEMDRTNSMLRDLLNANFNNIHVNDSKVYDELKTYLGSIAPDKVEIVKHYNNPKVPIFDHFGIEKQIKGLFGKP